MFGERIIILGNVFKERLDPDLIDTALDYIDFNEEGLALEILCDHIIEYNIAITQDEFELIVKLSKEMNLEPFEHLKQQIVS